MAMGRFASDAEGVTPVIGTLMMVAIVVVLSGGVAFVMGEMGAPGEGPPPIGFMKDAAGPSLTVVKAPIASDVVYYGDLAFAGDCTATGVNGDAWDAAVLVRPGDVIGTDCASGDSLLVRHVATNALVFEADFS